MAGLRSHFGHGSLLVLLRVNSFYDVVNKTGFGDLYRNDVYFESVSDDQLCFQCSFLRVRWSERETLKSAHVSPRIWEITKDDVEKEAVCTCVCPSKVD